MQAARPIRASSTTVVDDVAFALTLSIFAAALSLSLAVSP